MTYTEAMAYIRQIQTGAAIKPGLFVTRTLMKYLDHPQDRLSFIHIAGTNGKGSTAAFISAMYVGQGLKVGRYVTPAVFSEREQIQYSYGRETVLISEQEMAQYVTQIREAVEQMQCRGEGVPTVFEIETAVAFLAFAGWQCDLVVLETGMGGGLDATNIIGTPVCAVITPISFDHMAFLGDSIEKIAEAKAGIIKGGAPVVMCQHRKDAEQVLIRACREQKCEFHTVLPEEISIRESWMSGTSFDYKKYKKLHISMPGLFQVENACLAVECVEAVQDRFPIGEQEIRNGLADAVWRGRFEMICADPVIIIDGAHNSDGVKRLLESIDLYYKEKTKIAIMGVLADKDYAGMADQIGTAFAHMYTVTPPSTRGLAADILAETLNRKILWNVATACDSMEEAVRLASDDCKAEEGVLIIFGSLTMMESAAQQAERITEYKEDVKNV